MPNTTSQPEWLKNLIAYLAKESGIKPSDLHEDACNLRILETYELPAQTPEFRQQLEQGRHRFISSQVEGLAALIDQQDSFHLARHCKEVVLFHEKEASADGPANSRIATANNGQLESFSGIALKKVESCQRAYTTAVRKSHDDADALATDLARAECTHEIIAALYWSSVRHNGNPTAFGNFVSAVRKAHIAHATWEAYRCNNHVRPAQIRKTAGSASDTAMLKLLMNILPTETPAVIAA